MTEENLENTPDDTQDKPDQQVSQDEIEKSVEQQMQEALEKDNTKDAGSTDTAEGEPADTVADEGVGADSVQMPNMVKQAQFPQLSQDEGEIPSQNIGLLLDVPMPISIELGRTAMTIESILDLGPGSVVELNKLAGEPVDLLVNNKLIAKGEVVVVDENFGIRITDLLSPQDRFK